MPKVVDVTNTMFTHQN